MEDGRRAVLSLKSSSYHERWADYVRGANRCMFNFRRANGNEGDLKGWEIRLLSETHLLIEIVFDGSVWIPFIELYG